MSSGLIERIREAVDSALQAFQAAPSAGALEAARIEFLGAKGRLAELMKALGALPKEERPEAGSAANAARQAITAAHQAAAAALERQAGAADLLDVTLPGRRQPRGHQHVVSRTAAEICDIFARLGFSLVEGPEVETDFYNFEALNFPPDHPARDMQDTLFVSRELLLRTHTSPMQVRTMEKTQPPVWVVVPGKTYRRDSDISHSPMFHQVEGLVVDQGITFADLKGVLTAFAAAMFSPDTQIRLRPSFFPFTEPSAEVDIACVLCHGAGCRLCKGTGWLEILGSGMVDPAVYGFVGYDPDKVSGFAFGMGIERVAMLKYGLDDIRMFYESDLRFLTQF
ncbi:MAG: phenylalanine--tRNA ligase subunit alpha [Candidatus Adiutrix sp.]|jgi:phenylalanyl-tRNA synthetase alpha chain|nr:phenylalanine--tRNA ligase subunit alpha [Candidatus Adiutrix sp.]